MPNLALLAGSVLVTLVAAVAAILVWRMARGQIDLTHLIAEASGQASLSRFQFLLFTFVVATCLVVLTLESGQFPEIGNDVLGLVGISGGSYVVSKGIQYSGGRPPAPPAGSAPPNTAGREADVPQTSAEVRK